MNSFKDPREEETWYAVEITSAGELVYIGVVDNVNYTGNVACRVFMFLNGGEKWECINNEPVTQAEAEQICREKLSDYFDDKGCYPKYNQDEFLAEFKKKFKQYENGWHGPIQIKKEVIEEIVDLGHPDGNYIYCHKDGKEIIADYVGRSEDAELQERMQHRLDPNDIHYKEYNKRGTSLAFFRYAANLQEAIEIECLQYHYYGGKKLLINDIHPAIIKDVPCPISLCKEHVKIENTKII